MSAPTGRVVKSTTQIAEDIFRPRLDALIDEQRRNRVSRLRLEDEANIIHRQIMELENERLDFINNHGYAGGRPSEGEAVA